MSKSHRPVFCPPVKKETASIRMSSPSTKAREENVKKEGKESLEVEIPEVAPREKQRNNRKGGKS